VNMLNKDKIENLCHYCTCHSAVQRVAN